MSIVVESGAIQNHFAFEGTENQEQLAETILSILDESLIRILSEKVRDLKSIMND